MSAPERDTHSPGPAQPEALELNKETLQDLDVEATDADGVKGGVSKLSGGTLLSDIRLSVQADSLPLASR